VPVSQASIARSSETARHEKRIPHFSPSRFYQTAQDRTNSTPLRQRHVIEIKRARGRHPVGNAQDYLSCQPSDVRVAGTTMISFSRPMT
jgi:hypothetical protein